MPNAKPAGKQPTALLTLVVVLGQIGLGAAAAARPSPSAQPVVGISMPDMTEERWVTDGSNLTRDLRALGYDVDIRNAGGDVVTQISSVADMVARGDKAIVIAPVVAFAFNDVVARASKAGIKIIAYDRQLQDTPHVDYYASFDNREVGAMQAEALLRGLHARPTRGPFPIELFAGSPNDSNARILFKGAMSVLDPLIRRGTLVVRSGQTTMRAAATLRWSGDAAHARLDNLLDAYYLRGGLAGVLAQNDVLARGVIASLVGGGYGTGRRSMPVVVGQDCDLASVRDILSGVQYASVFKDTRRLAALAASVVDALLHGRPPSTNVPGGFDNGAIHVPATLLTPVLVDRANAEAVLVGSGYYSAAQLR